MPYGLVDILSRYSLLRLWYAAVVVQFVTLK